ncbi:hypothetical protein ACIOBK_22890 [Micromonospora chokoriensis]
MDITVPFGRRRAAGTDKPQVTNGQLRRKVHVTPEELEALVTATTPTDTVVAEVMAELAALEDPRTREVNAKHGDDHGVHLGKLRALAKRLKT